MTPKIRTTIATLAAALAVALPLVVAGPAAAEPDYPVNDIKIGNRSQVSAATTASDATPRARPQTLVFKVGRFSVRGG